MLTLLLLSAVLPTALLQDPPSSQTVIVDRDNVVIERSCRLRFEGSWIEDSDGNGVVHITGSDITVRFDTPLSGAAPGTRPDRYQGLGVRITGERVTLERARISGFRVGIRAEEAHGSTIEQCEVRDVFRQRLGSGLEAEDPADWLWPHANDGGEWLAAYGAAIAVERSRGVTVRNCRARQSQNGLVLDRVEEARVYDNDFSFLSGWGIALWRSSRNVISRNAVDFCVRGYSHGIYNRGQDSAGILLFEQCSENLIAENSGTHCGDGLFAFAGQEALGQTGFSEGGQVSYLRRGNNDNLIIGNDFSYAVAHGIEVTFSFGNRIVENRLVENAICGIWGGYSRDTLIAGNRFVRNGGLGYGLERGGVNIEHGQRTRIVDNTFEANRCGVHLWWDPDENFAILPWSKANGPEAKDNVIVGNRFRGDELVLLLRSTESTVFARNETKEVGKVLEATDGSEPEEPGEADATWERPTYEALGKSRPVGAREELQGRERIVMTPWGPYDWESPLLQRIANRGGRHVYRVLGSSAIVSAEAGEGLEVTVRPERDGALPELEVFAKEAGVIAPYELTVRTREAVLQQSDVFVRCDWTVRCFAWENDPRIDVEAWRAEAEGAPSFRLARLHMPFKSEGPAQLGIDALADSKLPVDRFGTIAVTKVLFPAGEWSIRTSSDDGVRVWIDGELVIDDWTLHAARSAEAKLRLEQPKHVTLRVEHFEVDGASVLSLEIERDL